MALLALLLVWSPVGGWATDRRAGGRPETGGVDWRVSASPFRLTFLDGGRLLTSEVAPGSGGTARLSYSATDAGPVHTLTQLVDTRAVADGRRYTVLTDEPGRSGLVTVTRTRTGLRVDFRLQPAGGIRRLYEVLSASATEHFLGGGEQNDFVDLRGQVVPLLVGYSCGVEFPMPFFLSSGGYGVFVASNRSGRFAFPGADRAAACQRGPTPACPVEPTLRSTEICLQSDELSYHLYAGPPERLMKGYTADAGRSAPAPLEQFGAQKWRGVGDENIAANVLGDVLRYRQLRIPLSWIHINDPWEERNCWGTFVYDPSRFPDPARLVSQIHSLGVRVMLWVSPLVDPSSACPSLGYPARDLLGPGSRAPELDLTDPTALQVFERRLRAALSVGIDGIKGDRGDEIDLTKLDLHGGPGLYFQNSYPELFAKAVVDVLRSLRGSSFATVFRAGSLGSQALLPGIWVGDLPGTFQGMRTAIRRGLSAGVSGYPVWGSDIGGYSNADPPLSAELFVRWAQLAAVSPIFEVGGLGESSHFWDFGPQIVDDFRAASILHYELAPYLYQLSQEASTTGVPIVRPLAFDFPHDLASWRNDLEFTVGPSLLAAPVPGQAGGAVGNTLAKPAFYLPPGEWVDLFNSSVLAGGRTISRLTPLSEFPLSLRAGAAIPFDLRDPRVWRTQWGLDELEHPGRAGWLYAPGAGPTTAAAAGHGQLSLRPLGGTIGITVTHAPKQVQVLVLTRTTPASVSIDGRRYPRSTGFHLLQSALRGWTTRADSLVGVLIKLTTTGGRASAVIQTR